MESALAHHAQRINHNSIAEFMPAAEYLSEAAFTEAEHKMYTTGMWEKDGSVFLHDQRLRESGRVTAAVCCHHATNSTSLLLQLWNNSDGRALHAQNPWAHLLAACFEVCLSQCLHLYQDEVSAMWVCSCRSRLHRGLDTTTWSAC